MRGTKPAMVTDPDATGDILPPPAWMDEDASAEWTRVQPILAERRILTEADIGCLESYCTSMGVVRKAQQILKTEGIVLEGKRHPAFGIMNAAQTTARLLAAELGLTPVSRSRPAIREDDDADTILDY